MIINGENLILGRLATYTAKQALLGEKVDIINAEKVVVTGKKQDLLKRYRERVNKGDPLKGPYFPRMPDRLVRRAIRTMLPYKKQRGSLAFKKIMCYIGTPTKFKDKETKTLKSADIQHSKTLNFMTVDEICKRLK